MTSSRIEFDFSRVQFPAGMPNVYRFEEDNRHLSVNIFVHSEGEFYPAHSTNLDGRDPSEHIGVNIVQNTAIDITSGEMVDRYYPVTNLSKFAQKKYISKVHGKTSYGHNISCDICMRSFKCEKSDDHTTSFILENGEIHLGFNQMNMTQTFINHIFLCRQGN